MHHEGSILDAQELIRFLDVLRLNGYAIGVEQHLQVELLIRMLFERGELPKKPEELQSILAPLLCSTELEQHNFKTHFHQWASKFEEKEDPQDALIPSPPLLPPYWVEKYKYRLLAGLVILLSTLAALLSPIIWPETDGLLTGTVVFSENESLVSEAEVIFFNKTIITDSTGAFLFSYPIINGVSILHVNHPQFGSDSTVVDLSRKEVEIKILFSPRSQNQATPTSQTQFNSENKIRMPEWLRFSIAANLFLVLFFLGLQRWYKIPDILSRRSTLNDEDDRHSIRVKGDLATLFRGSTFKYITQEMRRHKSIRLEEIDIEKTAVATANKGGYFSPEYKWGRVSPEYLILIDRNNYEDQLASLNDYLVAQLEEGGLFIDCYYFDQKPFTFQSASSGRFVSLQELQVAYPDHRLLIFSEATPFISPIYGRLYPWAERFETWKERAILTPGRQYSFVENSLSKAGFWVLPATENGMRSLVDILQTDQPPSTDETRSSLYPEILITQPGRWISRSMPDSGDINILCRQLTQYLGKNGYLWLCACAVYPEMNWNITLHLGQQLSEESDSPRFNEATLSKLSRLPWFRECLMPDWFRERLIADLMPDQESTIREVIQNLLDSAQTEEQGFALKIAHEEKTFTPDAWVMRTIKWLTGENPKEPDASPLRDYVFLNVMGFKPNKLFVKAPAAIRNILFPYSNPLLFTRIIPFTIFIALLAVFTWFFIPQSFSQTPLLKTPILPQSADFFEIVEYFISFMNGLLAPILILLLLGTGLWLTFRLGFIQLRKIGHSIAVTSGRFDNSDEPGDISHFQALTTALSATVGIGNIAGVAIAIHWGGPGALFWMWVTAILGMATKFSEVTLAQHFRQNNEDGPNWAGSVSGGPMYYIEHGLGKAWKPVAIFFALMLIMTSFFTGNAIQANTVATQMYFNFQVAPWITGLITASLVGFVIVGGIRRIGAFTSIMTPLMASVYIIGALFIILSNPGASIGAFSIIINEAFNPTAGVAGTGVGVFLLTMQYGIQRGLFSNEAGQGSSPIAHSAAKTDEPVSEGVVALLEPFIDTIIICTLTGLVIVATGVWNSTFETEIYLNDSNISYVTGDRATRFDSTPTPDTIDYVNGVPANPSSDAPKFAYFDVPVNALYTDAGQTQLFSGTITPAEGIASSTTGEVFFTLYGDAARSSSPLTSLAFERGLEPLGFGWLGRYIVLLCVLLFAISTSISWSYYGDRCANYIWGARAILPYKFVFVFMHFIGAILAVTTIWDLGDVALSLVTIPNCLALLLLSGVTKKLTDRYFERKPWQARQKT